MNDSKLLKIPKWLIGSWAVNGFDAPNNIMEVTSNNIRLQLNKKQPAINKVSAFSFNSKDATSVVETTPKTTAYEIIFDTQYSKKSQISFDLTDNVLSIETLLPESIIYVELDARKKTQNIKPSDHNRWSICKWILCVINRIFKRQS